MTKVKICGIRTEEHALTAAEAGADYIGMVFASSPRQVTPAQAQKIAGAIKNGNYKDTEVVGVFVNTPADVVNRVAEFCGLDYVQISGDETMEYCQDIKKPIFKAIKIKEHYNAENIGKYLTTWRMTLADHKLVFLLDTFDEKKYGGTGKLLALDAAASITEQFEVIIAGGLNPENVAEVIKKLKPWGVDVSSGVETKGEKDMLKIKAFIKAVRCADAE